MTLPDLALQTIYARVAWGIVLAAILVGPSMRWSSRREAPWRRAPLILGCLALVVMWLPGPASPAFWLGLAFSYPSVMLVACCAVSVLSVLDRSQLLRGASCTSTSVPGPAIAPALNTPLAVALVAGGALLYADAAGLLGLQIYGRGFETPFAPVAALAVGAGALWAIRLPSGRTTGVVLLGCVMVFTLARLPSGNVFDALLDPIMWLWAAGVSLQALRSRLRTSTGAVGSRPL